MATTSTKKKGDKESLHARAVERFKELEDFWSHNHKEARKDIRFRNLEQWPDDIKRTRGKRPTLVVDKLGQYVRQVVNDGRQNRPGINTRGVDSKADPKVAEKLKGIVRGIMSFSNADEAIDTALDHAAGHGFGFMRVCTDYTAPDSFVQDIYVKRISNALSVLLAPHTDASGADAEDCFIVENVPMTQFERKWPNAEKTDWKADTRAYAEGWLADKHVRVAEWFYREPVTRTIYLLDTGETAWKEDYERMLKATGFAPPIVKDREVQTTIIKWCRLTGAEILEQGRWVSDNYLPIIPLYGSELNVEGKVIYSGLIRPGRDPQMLYNFSRSAFAERVALAPKAPWVAAVGQVEDHDEWKDANEKNYSVLTYTPISVDGVNVPPPQRTQGADVPAGFMQDMQLSEHDIQAAIGMYNSSLGERSNEKSGKAILARQRQGDVGTFHYQDNTNRAVRQLGRVIVDIIPKVYDTPRVVRWLGEDGKEEPVKIDPRMPEAVQDAAEGSIYNLNIGKYDVDVSTGPSYNTLRQEANEAMMEMTKGNPELWVTHGDLIAKMQDWPGAEEFAKRTKAVMPPALKKAIMEAENEETGGGSDPKVEAVMAYARQMMQEAQAQLEKQQQMLEAAANEIKRLESGADVKRDELEVKKYDAVTKRLEMLLPVLGPDALALLGQQTTASAVMSAEDLDSLISEIIEEDGPSGIQVPDDLEMEQPNMAGGAPGEAGMGPASPGGM